MTKPSDEFPYANPDLLDLDNRQMKHQFDSASEMSIRALEWVCASVFALHAGGVVATLSSASSLSHPRLSGLIFALGIFASLAAATSWMLRQAAKMRKARNRLGINEEVRLGLASEDVYREHVGEYMRTPVKFYAVYAWQLASVVLLMLGSVVLATSFASSTSADIERCRAIQYDMLSAHPRKPDGAALFQAFGCHPTGNDPRIFVPATDKETNANKPLPNGGYPRPRI